MNDRRRVARYFGLLCLLLLLAGDVRKKNPCCCVMPLWSKGESLLWEGVFLEEAPTERCSQSLNSSLVCDSGSGKTMVAIKVGVGGKTTFLRFYKDERRGFK